MIIAVDFDGVLCESRFPEIGAPDYEVVSLVRQLIDTGHEVILWTSRTGDRLTEAVEWCEDRGLHFCAVNGNAPSNRERFEAEYPHPSPKVYADVYVEDHDLLYRRADRLHREGVREHHAQILESGRQAVVTELKILLMSGDRSDYGR
jgi:hypothetical protein